LVTTSAPQPSQRMRFVPSIFTQIIKSARF